MGPLECYNQMLSLSKTNRSRFKKNLIIIQIKAILSHQFRFLEILVKILDWTWKQPTNLKNFRKLQ